MIWKINWDHKRVKHAIERMTIRGITANEVKEAIVKGRKVTQEETKLIESYFRYFSVVYDEQILKKTNLRKIYPITVKLWR